MLHLEAQLSQPAYAYLLWLDSEGTVTPLWPWNDTNRLVQKDAAQPPPLRPPQTIIQSPPGQTQGWRVGGRSGLDTILLLARRTPLPEDVLLASLIGKLPATRLRNPKEWAIRGAETGQSVAALNRGGDRGPEDEAAAIDDPLVQLMGRLQPYFEVIRAVRFAHQE